LRQRTRISLTIAERGPFLFIVVCVTFM